MSIIYAKSAPEWTPLKDHLEHVKLAIRTFARHLGLDEALACNGAILHDIGKVHPAFQQKLLGKANRSKPFRHEVSSLLFLSVFPEHEYAALIEMVVGHHKSVKNDAGNMGLLDLERGYDYMPHHLGDWEEWSERAIRLLNDLGVPAGSISRDQALINLQTAINHSQRRVKERGYSEWRGLLMGADHFASALIGKTEKQIKRAFIKPDLSFFLRRHHLYPLSLKTEYLSPKRHTLAVACTGAGKTDFLFKRCNGRVFYTLPYQASINAMFKRVAKDLETTNPDLNISVLHAASMVVKRTGDAEESVLQPLFGASVKILTPHQLAAIAFGMKGFEAILLDLKGCDVILDEIHTYTGVSQAIVLKLVEILHNTGCRIHIGTATMPSVLYNRILGILGDDVLEVKLTPEEQDLFDRHCVHKIKDFEEAEAPIRDALANNQKILVVLNRVERSRNVYERLAAAYPDVPVLLLHSRFRRGDRNEKEKLLIGLDDTGISLNSFNTSPNACIVVSTQIVEVSLDISFDLMVTECAPLDALIQRFGRINRKRSPATLGNLKDVYVMAPPDNITDARPYDPDVLRRSFDVLPNGETLHERDLQHKIDLVYAEIDFLNIEEHSKFKSDGRITIDKLTHVPKSILFELLEIDSVSCIIETDQRTYENADFEDRLNLEIPVRYHAVHRMNQSSKGNKPFIIPDAAYDFETGLDISKIRPENLDAKYQFL